MRKLLLIFLLLIPLTSEATIFDGVTLVGVIVGVDDATDTADNLLLETGDNLLLETGDLILLE
jgi:hypothetical protein